MSYNNHYVIQYLAQDGCWRVSCRMSGLDAIRWCERAARGLSNDSEYRDVPIRTMYGDSLSPVSVYVNGVNVRDAWVDKDMGHPHLHTTVLAIRARRRW